MIIFERSQWFIVGLLLYYIANEGVDGIAIKSEARRMQGNSVII